MTPTGDTKMNIRKMTIEDYDRVYALWLSCKGMGLNDLDDSREGIERFLKRNPDTCFAAEDGGAVIGAGKAKSSDGSHTGAGKRASPSGTAGA